MDCRLRGADSKMLMLVGASLPSSLCRCCRNASSWYNYGGWLKPAATDLKVVVDNAVACLSKLKQRLAHDGALARRHHLMSRSAPHCVVRACLDGRAGVGGAPVDGRRGVGCSQRIVAPVNAHAATRH